MNTLDTVTYELDHEDRIVAWNVCFSRFGRANGLDAWNLQRGDSIWDYIHGEDETYTQRWLAARARERAEGVRYRFRCDSFDEFRLMEMRIRATSGGGLEYTSVPLLVRPLTEGPDLKSAPLPVCAWCLRVASPQGWVEVEAGILPLDRGDPRLGQAITHGICGECSAEMLKNAEDSGLALS